MNEVVWETRPPEMLANGQSEMNNVHFVRHGATRSQDDAMVGYFFQRPQTDPAFQNYHNKQSRWALGDDSVLEVRACDSTELESDFQALALETSHPLEIPATGKKLPVWGMEDSKPDDGKGLFLADQWREPAWSTGHNSASGRDLMIPLEHAVSQPIMVQRRSGSYPGSDANTMLSPRSSETSGLGVKMAEYVLGSSPTTKDLDSQMARLHVGLNSADGNEKGKKPKPYDSDAKRKESDGGGILHANGIIQNGLEDDQGFSRTPGSRQPSPCEEDMNKNPTINDISKLQNSAGEHLVMHPGAGGLPQVPGSLGLDGGFEPVGIDSLPFDYPSHLMQSVDSPNVLDYINQRSELSTQQLLSHLYQQRSQVAPQGQPLTMMPQQQYPLPSQQQGQSMGAVQPGAPTGTPTQFTQNPYIMNQDPYAMGTFMAGPAMMPQYYGMPPWGMFPTPGIIQGSQGQPQGPTVQQHILRSNGTRPMTPQGNGESLPQGANNIQAQSKQMSNGGLPILLPEVQQLQNPTASLFSAHASNPACNTHYTSANSNLTFNQQTNNLAFSGSSGFASGLGMGHSQTQASMVYGSSPLGPIGSSGIGAIGSGLGNTTSSPHRDLFDRRDSTGLGSGFSSNLENQYSRQIAAPKSGQFFGQLGAVTGSSGPIGMLPLGQSLTPPPSINGSSTNLNLGALSSRMLSAAPGAEAKYMVRNGPLSNNMFGSSNSLFPSRHLQRNSSLEKPTGRSHLLEDFRNNRYPNLQLRDLANHIVEFSQDQHGSRFIQQKLERAIPAEKQMVFNEILGDAYSLMTDVFGNYVIQKFFEFGTPEQKQALTQKVKGHVLPLALQMYGCRVIQKALESIPSDQQKEVVKELDGHVLKCVKDQNGNHVVQKCIECVDPLALQFIINAFQGQVFALSTHPYGCRVIQRILEHCTSDQTTPILEELHQNTEQLVQDQYGNYVIQHVLERGRPDDKSKILSVVRGKVLPLSQHKFASNVVEKCVTNSSRTERAMLIEEVCTCNDGPHSALYTMMKDQYANYVVQKMIEVVEPPQRKLLVHKIRPHITALRKYTYGKHILAKLEKHLMKTSDLGPIGPPQNGAL
ncbi:pumilio homolog 1-like isoform X5 [Tachypleus tridentatus]|uniref:pumilio homolog 1-like isoform X5 n=1 Tax=Tachypleus tridentatus TaxID=6853 RepID=UPI003FCF98BC